MKRIITITAITIALITSSGMVSAGKHNRGFSDKAKVVSAQPIYETIEVARPTEECWTERVSKPRHNRGHKSYTSTIVGGILGGVVGNQFGKGKGKTAMTAAGTLLGASIGHDVSSRHRATGRRVTHERRCEMVNRYEQREELVGYRVKYRYKGQTFTTRTQDHPGKRIRVRVQVEPI
ncbi:MAG: glycine zipper 2TM domain-containing protein [Gammaproteobacteria bacterium]|nr:glycine zipper 2TM domain-containing protein [Gammaproteobacteria bacterium]